MTLAGPNDNLNLIKTKSIISVLLVRIKLMKQNKERGKFSQFPNLKQSDRLDDDILTLLEHSNALYFDFQIRFENILNMVIS